MLPTRPLFPSSCAALLFVVTAGCGGSDDNQSDDRQTNFETDPSVLRAALENPIISCQQARRECRSDAEDAEQRAACNDELATCLQTAADKAQAAASALSECRDEARECAAGDTKLSECRSTYESCTEAALNGDEPAGELDASVDDDDVSDAGSDDDSDDDSDTNSDSDAGVPSSEPTPGGNSALPSLPGPRLDGGILAGLPRPEQCIIELRLCIFKDPGSASDCSDEARLCLKL